jgi:hypothetical protein
MNQKRRRKKKESADKPGSVWGNHSSAMRVAAHLKRPTREHMRAACAAQSCDWTACPPIWSCSGRGLPCRRVLPPARCALTAPFHPYRRAALGHALRRFAFCCTFRGLAPPRRYLASCPGSPDFPPPLRAAVAWPTPTANDTGKWCRLFGFASPLCGRRAAWRAHTARCASRP